MSGPWVLVIDDDADICEMVIEALREEGIRAECETGWRALQAAEERQPALILLDLMLPLLDGPQILSYLRQAEATRAIPIVVMTAIGADVRESVEGLGAAGYLPKPFDLAELAAVVRRVWSKEGRGP